MHSNTSVFKTTTVFFSGKYGFNLSHSSLKSALYSCPTRTSRFFETVATTSTTMTLGYNTQQIMKFLAIQLIKCRVLCSENLLHWSTLLFTTTVASGFCAIIAMRVLTSITSSNYVGGIPCMPMHNEVVFSSCLLLTSCT